MYTEGSHNLNLDLMTAQACIVCQCQSLYLIKWKNSCRDGSQNIRSHDPTSCTMPHGSATEYVGVISQCIRNCLTCPCGVPLQQTLCTVIMPHACMPYQLVCVCMETVAYIILHLPSNCWVSDSEMVPVNATKYSKLGPWGLGCFTIYILCQKYMSIASHTVVVVDKYHMQANLHFLLNREHDMYIAMATRPIFYRSKPIHTACVYFILL